MIDWNTFKSQLQSDPGRMLKSVLLLAGCLFMIWLIVVMQSNPGMQQNVQIQNSGRLDSLGIAEMQSGSGDSLAVKDARLEMHPGDSLGAADSQTGDSLATEKMQSTSDGNLALQMNSKNARTNDTPVQTLSPRSNGFSGIFPTVLIFLVLIGGAWYWLRTQKKSDKSKGEGQLFTTIASQHLPGGTQLTVVKLNGEYWVMASGGPQGTQLLHRYTPEEWQGLEKKQEKQNWKNTFLKTLNSSTPTLSSQQKKTG